MRSELVYRLALTLVPSIGDVHARQLVEHFGNATSVFNASIQQLEKVEGLGPSKALCIQRFTDFDKAEKERHYIEKYGLRTLFLTDKDYPQRLLNCYDAPILLFYKGTANLNASRMLGIVGSRNHTEYGRQFTEKLVKELADEQVTIISGLAFGIDALAHRAALKNGLPTIGVVGHGLDTVYPPEHLGLARDMLKAGGGLLSEFFFGTIPDKHNFPLRNRIVAGLCDATVVIETEIKGGSMITANLADAYHRDVFALPGRTTDKKSSGCNHLIKHNKAMMLTCAQDLLEVMGWTERKVSRKLQRSFFVELSEEQRLIVEMLQEKEMVNIDEINLKSGMSTSQVAAILLNLELEGLVESMPGKVYRLM
jgi:DNA processing protein